MRATRPTSRADHWAVRRASACLCERRSSAGIVIPATASIGRRLSWATAVGIGPNVRSIVVGDRVLFDPDERSELELHGREYILLRERDVHAVAAQRLASRYVRPGDDMRIDAMFIVPRRLPRNEQNIWQG